MRILHVILGNPRKHQGGINKYCLDLAMVEKAEGHDVTILYPGELSFFERDPKIVQTEMFEGVRYHAVKHALPVAITYGIGVPEHYMASVDMNIYVKYLQKNSPDIIHMHSIMGVHRELIHAAAKLNIPILYTTHDFSPICMRCTLMMNSGTICAGRDPRKCAICNKGSGLSKWMQAILQSELYRKLRENKLISALKKMISKKVIESASNMEYSKMISAKEIPSEDLISRYADLMMYYDDIMSAVTLIHCNSNLTKEIYENSYPHKRYKVVPITHWGLWHKKGYHKRHKELHIGYLGGQSIHKGYNVLMDALNELDKRSIKNWNIALYGGIFNDLPDDERYYGEGYYTRIEEDSVWNNIDLLVVPSLCRETYGFTILEALCRNIPVICSDMVGSKYLLKNYNYESVFCAGDSIMLADIIQSFIQNNAYDRVCKEIEESYVCANLVKHTLDMIHLYEECIELIKV